MIKCAKDGRGIIAGVKGNVISDEGEEFMASRNGTVWTARHDAMLLYTVRDNTASLQVRENRSKMSFLT